jgi:hypothetical protein
MQDPLGVFAQHLQDLTLKKLRSLYAKTRAAMEQSLEISSTAESREFLAHRLAKLQRAAEKHLLKVGRSTTAPAAPVPRRTTLLCGLPWRFRVCRFTFDCALAGREVGGKLPRRNAQKVCWKSGSNSLTSVCVCVCALPFAPCGCCSSLRK